MNNKRVFCEQTYKAVVAACEGINGEAVVFGDMDRTVYFSGEVDRDAVAVYDRLGISHLFYGVG